MFKPRPKSACEFQRDNDSLATSAFGAGDDQDKDNVNNAINKYSPSMHVTKPVVKLARRKSTPDASFTFSKETPPARRHSVRLAKKNPEFSTKELPKDEGTAYNKNSEFKNRNDGNNASNAINGYSESIDLPKPILKRTRRKSIRDASFPFLEQIPTDRRQSLKLANKGTTNNENSEFKNINDGGNTINKYDQSMYIPEPVAKRTRRKSARDKDPEFSSKELPKNEGSIRKFKCDSPSDEGNQNAKQVRHAPLSIDGLPEPIAKRTRRKSTRDASCSSLEQIPTESGQSLKSANKDPEFSSKELPKMEDSIQKFKCESPSNEGNQNAKRVRHAPLNIDGLPEPIAKRTRRKSTRDAPFSISEQIPTESGQSLKLVNKDPEISSKELPKNEDSIQKFKCESPSDEGNQNAKRVRHAPLNIDGLPEPIAKRTRRKSTPDASSILEQIPAERGQKLRLFNKAPEFSSKELPKNEGSIRKFKCKSPSDEGNQNAKRVRHAPLSIDGPLCSKKRTQTDFDTGSSSKNKYSYDGNRCHQCQQNTFDAKTYCRSPGCNETRGLFCGPCLKNIYGEEVKETLQNVIWLCPVCRGICNCFLCCVRRGKAPTGIRVPQAFNECFNSAKNLLNKKEILDYLGLTSAKNKVSDTKLVIIKIPRRRVADMNLSSLIFENLARELAEVDVVCYGKHVFRIKLEYENDNKLKRETNETINEILTEISEDIGKKFLEKNNGKQLVILLDRCDAVTKKTTSGTRGSKLNKF